MISYKYAALLACGFWLEIAPVIERHRFCTYRNCINRDEASSTAGYNEYRMMLPAALQSQRAEVHTGKNHAYGINPIKGPFQLHGMISQGTYNTRSSQNHFIGPLCRCRRY